MRSKTSLLLLFFCAFGCSRSTEAQKPEPAQQNQEESPATLKAGTAVVEAAGEPESILETNPLRIYGRPIHEHQLSAAQLGRLIDQREILEIADYPDGGSTLHQQEITFIADYALWNERLAQRAWALDKRLYAFLPDRYKNKDWSWQYIRDAKDREQAWWRIQHYVPMAHVSYIFSQME